jgi:hypothetical protein
MNVPMVVAMVVVVMVVVHRRAGWHSEDGGVAAVKQSSRVSGAVAKIDTGRSSAEAATAQGDAAAAARACECGLLSTAAHAPGAAWLASWLAG